MLQLRGTQKKGYPAVPKNKSKGKKQEAKEAVVVQPAVQQIEESSEEETPPAPIVSTTSRATADCQSAKEDSCSCRCRGRYHGKEHPKGWKDEEGCEPLSIEERKVAKKNALYAWRKAHPERVSKYMKEWRAARKEEEAEAQIVEAAEVAVEEDGEAEE